MTLPQINAPVGPPPQAQQAPAAAESPAKAYADWPQKGDDRAQPWDDRDNGTTREDRDELLDNPGAPNTVSPIVVGHSMPILTAGAGGEQAWAVRELARRLQVLGYQTDVGTTNNPFATVTSSVMGAVEHFREEHNVEEDPTAFGGNTAAARSRAATHVGPWTWEALIRASERKLTKTS